MLQEPLPEWPDATEVQGDEGAFVIPNETLAKLGRGDAAAGRRLLRLLIEVESERAPVNGPTERPANVRLATVADERSLVDLLRLDVAENAAHIAPLDVATLYTFVQSCTRDVHNLGAAKPTIAVIGAPGDVEGMIYLEPCRWFWARDHWFLEERLTAVRPDKRASRHAANLLRFARWFADAMSASTGTRVCLVASVVATRGSLQKQALFGRLMNRCGGIFTYPATSLD